MLKIAHRGNITGPNPEKENDPDYLLEAINIGFNVEADIWVIDDVIFLGHDKPEYLVPESFLIEIGNSAWFHCKNLEALSFFNNVFPQLNYFWHQEDDFTLTSQGYIWTYPGKPVSSRSVVVDLENNSGETVAFGICSNFLV